MAFTNFYQPIDWMPRSNPLQTVQKQNELSIQRLIENSQREQQLQMQQQQAAIQAQESQAAAQERAQKAEKMRQKAQEEANAKEIQMRVQRETQEWAAQNPNKSVYARGMYAAKRSAELGDLKTLKMTQDTLLKKMDAVKSLPELNEIREALELPPLSQKDWDNTRGIKTANAEGRVINLKEETEIAPAITAAARAEKALLEEQERKTRLQDRLTLESVSDANARERIRLRESLKTTSDKTGKEEEKLKAKRYTLNLGLAKLDGRIATVQEDPALSDEERGVKLRNLLKQRTVVEKRLEELGGEPAIETPPAAPAASEKPRFQLPSKVFGGKK